MSIEALKGLTLVSIKGAEEGSECITFETSCGRTFQMYHQQDCCESVYLESVVGDVADLVGHPILLAEEVEGEEPEEPAEEEYYPESHTWTFYKLATIKGYVDLRWYGSSNGYYSEDVDFEEVTKANQ